ARDPPVIEAARTTETETRMEEAGVEAKARAKSATEPPVEAKAATTAARFGSGSGGECDGDGDRDKCAELHGVLLRCSRPLRHSTLPARHCLPSAPRWPDISA